MLEVLINVLIEVLVSIDMVGGVDVLASPDVIIGFWMLVSVDMLEVPVVFGTTAVAEATVGATLVVEGST